MNEYMIRFLVLLEEGYRRQARHYAMLATITMTPHAEPRERQDFMHELDIAGKAPDDIIILTEDNNYTGVEQLATILNRNA